MSDRLKDIVIYLFEHNEQKIKAKELAVVLEISERSVRQEITDFQSLKSSQNFDIKSDQKGYWLETKLSKQELISHLVTLTAPSESYAKDIIRILLLKEDYLKVEKIAEKLFVSESTIIRNLIDVREYLKSHKLTLESKPSSGLKIYGDELNRRLCFVHINSSISVLEIADLLKKYGFDEEEFYRIWNIVNNATVSNVCDLTEIGIQNLILHIVYAIKRIKGGKNITNSLDVSGVNDNEILAVKEIVEQLQKMYMISFSQPEIDYLMLHLKSKRFNLNPRECHISEGIEKIIQRINEKILEITFFDFSKDSDLFYALALHLESMISRIRYGIRVPNPILEKIKIEYHDAFECAVIAADCIKREFGYNTNDDELTYLAIHYNVAISRIGTFENNKKFILVCSSGLGTAIALKEKIKKQFNVSEKNIELCSLASLKTLNIRDSDYVLSTVKIPYEFNHSVFYLDDLSSVDNQLSTIRTTLLDELIKDDLIYIDQEFSNKEEVLEFLIKEISNKREVTGSIKEFVFEREELSSTDIGNLVAIPHPSQRCTREMVIAVCLLRKAIPWGIKKAKYIFLVSYSEDRIELGHDVNEALIPLLMNAGWVSKLDDVKDVNMFRELIKNKGVR